MFCVFVAIAYLASLTQAAPQTYGVPVLDGRIVGGEPALIEQYPYTVTLQYSTYHTCGAVIISEDYVVTAAHCTDDLSVSYFTIRAGSSFLDEGGVVVQIAAIYQNPDYVKWNTDYDISVLRLATPLSFGSAIAPVALPELNQPIIAGAISQISGWGVLKEGGTTTPRQLQAAEVQLVSLEECRVAYGASAITDRMLCAGLPEGGKDACQGDSGGPLVVNGTLIGLVSWGRGCARPGLPGVYSSVPVLRDYITKVTGF